MGDDAWDRWSAFYRKHVTTGPVLPELRFAETPSKRNDWKGYSVVRFKPEVTEQEQDDGS